jgi:hypothetical protein
MWPGGIHCPIGTRGLTCLLFEMVGKMSVAGKIEPYGDIGEAKFTFFKQYFYPFDPLDHEIVPDTHCIMILEKAAKVTVTAMES